MGDSSNAQPKQAQGEKKNWPQHGARRANSGTQVNSRNHQQGRQNGATKPAQAQHANQNHQRAASSTDSTSHQAQNQLRTSGNNKQGKKQYKGQRPKKPRLPGAPLSPEVQKKIADLRQQTNEYFPEEEILNVLKQHNYDCDRTLQVLVEKRNNSWSSKVVKPVHTSSVPPSTNGNGSAQHQPPDSTQTPPATSAASSQDSPQPVPRRNGPTKAQGRKKKGSQEHQQQYQEVQKEGESHQAPKATTEHLNVDAKIANLEELVAKNLSVIEHKARHLQNLREELRSVKAERDAQIHALHTEKETLLAKSEQIQKELVANKQRVIEIDAAVKQLQQEKDQKIKMLEEKYQHAILDK